MSMVDVAPDFSSSAPAKSNQHVDAASLGSPAADPDAMDVSPSIETGIPPDLPQSQPMTATTSSASQHLLQADGDGSAEASIYGTRSRIKGGNARPNYADDRELDLEIEAAGRIQKTKSKKLNATATGAQDVPKSAPAPNGFAAVNAPIPNEMLAKDTLPGMLAFSTQPPPPVSAPSKKRKQPGSSATTSTPAPAPAQPTTKTRTSASAINSRLHLETNMMTFSRCRARLNAKKQLVADDGTALAVNGEILSYS